jgi:hypothetical protein
MIRFFKQLVGLVRRRSPGQRRLGVESLEDRLAPTATALAGPVVAVNPQPLPPGSPVLFAPAAGTTTSTSTPR